MIRSYRLLFSAKGSVRFTLAGLVARLPMGMFGVSILLLVADATGSYAVAGGVSAAGLVGVAIAAPRVGRLVDRYGQARIAVPATVISVVASTGTIICAYSDAPRWTLYVTYFLSAGVPFVGVMARARWVRIYESQPEMMQRANAFERVVDEITFISGPAVAAGLCVAFGPAAGLLTANTLLLVGTLLFAAQRSTEPTPFPHDPDAVHHRLLAPGVSAAVALFPIVGLASGAMEISTIAFVGSLNTNMSPGVFLALGGLGASVSGLIYGNLKLTSYTRRRNLLLSVILFLCMLPVPLVIDGNLWLFGLWAVVVGAATAPVMISAMGLLQQLTRPERLNEGMAIADSGLVIGMAAGAFIGGIAATQLGELSGFWVVSGAGFLVLLVAAAGARWWKDGGTAASPEPSQAGGELSAASS
ncbi:MFS transporter [Cellulomonas sp. URHD0024]|uniref:MFS transporter n=1 Tax=Cellulomonas sp. URHD0024 TaxID=1302620 RepID=UPI000423CDA1|nr:MFS transporter [Cellulomonas sp. URHD0024]